MYDDLCADVCVCVCVMIVRAPSLETYLKETDEILARLTEIDDNVQSTEDIINISLDSQRNSILFMEVRLAMGTFAVASGALFSSLFGMNLHTGMETSPLAFWMVSGASVSLAAMVFTVLRRKI